MKLTRILPLAIIPVAFALMTSCDSTSSSAAPAIANLYLGDGTNTVSLTAGQGSTTVHAEVTGDAGFSVQFTITDASNTDKTSSFTIGSFIAPTSSETDWKATTGTNTMTLAAPSSVANGTYTLTLKASNSSGSVTKTTTFNVTGGSTQPTDTALTSKATLDVGAQGVSGKPSFISLGTSSAKNASAALANVSAIDLVITYDVDITTQTNFESTAEGVGDGSLQNSAWGAGRHTIIKDLGTTAPAGIQAVRSALSGVTDEFAAIVNGHYYATKNADGVYAVLKVSNTSGTGNNMTLTVDVLGK